MVDGGSSSSEKEKGKDEEGTQEIVGGIKVVSPELRALLSRKVEVLSRKAVKGKGDGRSSLKKK